MSTARRRSEEGQSLVEYALLLILVAVAIILVLGLFGETLEQNFQCIVTTLNATQGSPIVGFTLVNSQTDNDIAPLCWQTVGLADMPNGRLTIRANTQGVVGSVTIQLVGPTNVTRTENIIPYSIFGDTDGDFAGGTLSPGDYTITATAYTGSGGSGTVMGTLTMDFKAQ
jgi:Flp pilus assembly pilin Flp